MIGDRKQLIFFYTITGLTLFYLLFTLFLTYLVQQIPREPVNDLPDWGKIIDTRIPAIDGGFLEVWRIEPDIVFAHGWGRNRGRMVDRARIFGQWGYTAVIHSARDHGRSSPKRFMNAVKFAEDIESILDWINKTVILYGHSAGAGGAIIAAHKNGHRIKLLFLEACYANTKEALLSLYRYANQFFGICFGPMILFWMNLFYGKRLGQTHPAGLAPELKMPVMLVHGEKDTRFPLAFALSLKESFLPDQMVDIYIAKGVDHSDSSTTSGYKPAVKAFLDSHA
ncbi:MAG: alpha/beta fold hydrolase [Deltaproteobacteria bacterium]|nr:alpha/beta fold hydrolase [Deltaproteobacteria bacterium]